MYRPIVRISVLYAIFAVFYYAISALLFFQDKKIGSNFLEKLFIALGDMFYWISVHSYFFLTIIISCIIGMIYCRVKKYPEAFKAFRNIGVGATIIVIVLIILANL